MKKVLSIFLFACFAIYNFGYYAFYMTYESHLESKWVDYIYGSDPVNLKQELIEIPLSAPYMMNQESFQATNTPFEKDGKYYRAIKQRYQNDTLQVVVVPDTSRKVLDNTVKKWISSLVDDELPTGEKGKAEVKLFVKDYIMPQSLGLSVNNVPAGNSLQGHLTFRYTNPVDGIDCPPPRFS
ncbi:hypothetical protein J2X69_001190 [Algoriphagus sp. 4150]|uniref:hypothetical protein n=1 Tax=Algoriphagus sp. 4150 TaxID=2817756 RepID=UPI002859EB5B|nr:hypothetical protein [Algoriphagus sp. 4150]MDR7128858.1 hypothetical protein [Algoriphagus sp. 4150]